MVDVSLIIEGIQISIEIYKRIKKVGKLPKKLVGLESHINYIEGILLDKRFEEKLKAGDYPRLTGILEELRDIVLHTFPNLVNKVKPEHKDLLWYVHEFIDVRGDEKKCEKLLTDIDSIVLKFSNALIMENFNDLKEVKDAIGAIKQLLSVSQGHDAFEHSNAKARENAVALVMTDEQDAKQFTEHVKALHNPGHSLITKYGNAEASGHGISISTSRLGEEAESMARLALGTAGRFHDKPTEKGKEKEKKKAKKEATSLSSSSGPSELAQPMVSAHIAPSSAYFASAHLAEGISLSQVSENEFKVVINYSKLRLVPIQIQALQALLTGLDGEQAYNAIENSSIKDKKGNITEISFEDKKSADTLISELNKEIRGWKSPSASPVMEGVTPTSNQF